LLIAYVLSVHATEDACFNWIILFVLAEVATMHNPGSNAYRAQHISKLIEPLDGREGYTCG
jgi:hypothetical protein